MTRAIGAGVVRRRAAIGAAFGLALATAVAASGAGLDRAVVIRVTGELTVDGLAADNRYQASFHLPVAAEHQAPLLVTVDSTRLVDWRLLRLDPPNVLGVATLERHHQRTRLDWESWVLVRTHRFDDRPVDVPLDELDDVPPDVARWLVPTDCVQHRDPMIVARAAAVRGDAATVDELAERITDDVFFYVYGVASMAHEPRTWDAFYAFTWGGSCVSHAHAAAALFRANGVPARNVHVVPTWTGTIGMHWLVEYWLPGYGWVRMEPSLGQHPVSTEAEVKTFVVEPHDEFPVLLTQAIEGHWQVTDPTLGRYNPQWLPGHRAYREDVFEVDADRLDTALELARDTFERTVDLRGARLDAVRSARLDEATAARTTALDALRARDLDGFIRHQRHARSLLMAATPRPAVSVLRDDFEAGPSGWSHGGAGDEWELGAPTAGPAAAHSGLRCWGTDLDGDYENDADSWLLSPPFSLDGLADAWLSFWLYLRVQDEINGPVNDPLWVEITSDGAHFTPISTTLAGGNDDPVIPDVGGWARVVLDLSRHLGPDPVRLRFRFTSDDDVVQAGAYVDDVEVTGRPVGSGVAPRRPTSRTAP